jgi:hypothetical protein
MIIKRLLLSILIATSVSLLHFAEAQVSIGGVINRYYPVTAFSASIGPCANPSTEASITVGPGYGAATPALAVGMRVLIIQMQAGTSGVITRTTTSAAYGDFTNAGYAGNYEFATISTVSGSVITFTKQLVNTYDPAGKVQIIPTFPSGAPWNAISTSNYTSSSLLTALPYDKTLGVGGVFVLETTGTITLGHELNVDALGFQGGDTIGNAYNPFPFMYIQTACCGSIVSGGGTQMDATNALSYAFPFVSAEARFGSVCTNTANRIVKGARKGQGIFGTFAGEELSWGKIANGGGGGHGYNSGGAGGGGYNGGGNGGYEHEWACNSSPTRPAGLDHGGRGGLGLQGGTTALFMGGGGGAGQGDGNSQTIVGLTTGGYAAGDFRGPTSGGDGGGIVMIKASQIIATGSRTISAKGGSGGYANADGAGGGGGGGSIILEVPVYSGTLTVDASGGAGGHAINPNSSDCHGPGGGGGGGRIMLSVGATPGGVTVNTNAGARGRLLQRTGSGASDYLFDKTTFCGGPDIFWGAGIGLIGSTTYNSVINTQGCSLPVTLMNIYVELLSDNSVTLHWETATEKNASHFIIERSIDGITYTPVGKVQAQGNSSRTVSYLFTDEGVSTSSGYIYYRLRMTDMDGAYEYSKTVGVNLKGTVVSVYPDPVKEGEEVTIVYYSNVASEEVKAEIIDLLGRHLNSKKLILHKGSNEFNLSTKGLKAGVYFIHLETLYGKIVKKIIVE